MTSSTSLNALLRGSKLLRDAMGADILQPGSRLRIARPIDAESLIGRHEGRARKVAGGAARPALSSALQKRIGPTRGLFSRTVRHGAFKYDPRQRAVVKVHYFGHGGGGATALRAHARYVARDASARSPEAGPSPDEVRKGDDGQAERSAEVRARSHAQYLSRGRDVERTMFYDTLGDRVDGAGRAAQWAKDDRRHFRLILAPENGTRLEDLKSYTREVMSRAEAALGTRLEWVAVDHWDTDNPHTHVILRGRHEDGRDLVIPREYVSHGFRNAARDIATERLGFRTRDDARLALQNEIRAHRPTRLDQIIAPQIGEDGTVRIARLRAPNGAPELTEALKARAHELKRLGLATETSRNVLAFDCDWRERLTAMELHLDIRKSLMRARAQDLARGPTDPARQLAKALRLPIGPDR
ncbi:MAG: type VI secretion protein [Alphaproteobacteria bacterium]|nr:MAG: type VI secretion protein [Caulobacteraceae bacterium]TPW07352.1 MAG: type VI secretion protein [Alphaproteobacteria bacterium]